MAAIAALDAPGVGVMWDALGRRIRVALEDDGSLGQSHVHVGAAPGERGHHVLPGDAFAERHGFELSCALTAASTSLLRELPLRQFAQDAVEALPDGADRDAVLTRLRSRKPSGDIYVAEVDGAGLGLFAAAPLDPHTPLGEYVGLLQEQRSVPNGGRADDYVCAYPADGLCVSAQHMGGLMRILNHADDGGANVALFPVFVDGAYHLAILTRSARIERGTQLVLDYGRGYWRARDRAPRTFRDAHPS